MSESHFYKEKCDENHINMYKSVMKITKMRIKM